MKKRLLFGFGAIALALLAVGGLRLLRSLSFFKVRRLELVGARYLTPRDAAAALAVPSGFSVFDNTGVLLRRARALTGVLEVRIGRRLPGTLRLVVREVEPVALAERGGRLVLVDSLARTLPFDPTRPAVDLPLADADSVVAGLLARLRETDPDFYARVERGSRIQRDVALDLGRGRVLLRAGATSEEIRDLVSGAEAIDRRGIGWRELDARYLPRLILRGKGG